MVGAVAQLDALIATLVAPIAAPGVFDDEGTLFGTAFLVCACTSPYTPSPYWTTRPTYVPCSGWPVSRS